MSWWKSNQDEVIEQSQQNVADAQQQFDSAIDAIERDMADYRQQLSEAQRQVDESRDLVDSLTVSWRPGGS